MDHALLPMVENRVFDDIKVGDKASVTRLIKADDIALFSLISGDINPAHLDPEFAATDMFHHIISQGRADGGADLRSARDQAAGAWHDLSGPGFAISRAGQPW